MWFGHGISVVSATTGHINANGQLDTTLLLSNGATVEVMNVSGLTISEWAHMA